MPSEASEVQPLLLAPWLCADSEDSRVLLSTTITYSEFVELLFEFLGVRKRGMSCSILHIERLYILR